MSCVVHLEVVFLGWWGGGGGGFEFDNFVHCMLRLCEFRLTGFVWMENRPTGSTC